MEERRLDKEGVGLPTRSVIFVEYSEGGILIKKVREVLRRMEGILGCKIKAVEKTGVPISRQFPLTNLWEGTVEEKIALPATKMGRIYTLVPAEMSPT